MSAPDVIERQQQAMQRLLMAATPGLLVLFWLYGWGVLINLLLAGTCAWAVEAGVRRLRGQGSNDLSGLVSATLLALALPLIARGGYAWAPSAVDCCWANTCMAANRTPSTRPCSVMR